MTAVAHPPGTAANGTPAVVPAAGSEGPGRLWPPRLSIGDAAAALGLAGLLTFAVSHSYERAFYGSFSLTPEAAGQGYTEILAKAATGGLGLLALLGTVAVGPALAATGRLRPPPRVPQGLWRTVLAAVLSGTAAWIVFVVAGQPPGDAADVAWPLGALAGALTVAAWAADHERGTTRRQTGPATWALAGLIVVLLAVLRAWDAGEDDARRLLRAGDARPHASLWQFLLGLPTPAVTMTWSEPGQPQPQQGTARLLRGDGDTLVVFDLDTCLLRRLPAGSVTTRSRIGAPGDAPSTLPTCPR